MVYHCLFNLIPGSSLEEAKSELSAHVADLYEIEDLELGKIQIGGYSRVPLMDESYVYVILYSCEESVDLNWHEQWACFAPGFDGEFVHIPLEDTTLILQPGPGFGDCSHPTTRLMLSLLSSRVQDRVVIDIGCGSGILSIAAALKGAKQVYGIDIDPAALEHSRHNAIQNGVERRVTFLDTLDADLIPDEEIVILMNMIDSEQRQAWEQVSCLHGKRAVILTSGILSSQVSFYLDYIQSKKEWTCLELHQEEVWSAFLFIS